ncbi:cytochrome P450 [Pleurotus eryngii]|uniref:Cytochrome P450 n=1 Tax=Pleurotus eryngii TaxID=5323 RepID=A0A9P6DID5_PLEER|nr:cytochrome P450 [Pleurotus eryngii]
MYGPPSEANREGGIGRIDVVSWLFRTILDVIGLAGFNYTFDALNKNTTPNELNQAFSTIFHSGSNNRMVMLLRIISPVFCYLRTSRDAVAEQAQVVMGRIGRELLNSSKAAIAQSERGIGDRSLRSRNLLSLLVRANTAAGIPESHRLLQDEDVLAQIPTFLVAGHETTSTATTWALFALVQESEMQTKLREELWSAVSFARHSVCIRLYQQLVIVGDEIPLSQPVTDVYGNIHHFIGIQKGQNVMIPIRGSEYLQACMGEDAEEFKPDRWLSPPQASNAIPDVWSNQMTFLGGPRACIGYRFSLVETKALLSVLIRAFTLELAVPANEIIKKASIVQQPLLKSNPEAGNVLPTLIKPYTRA